jgi:hypothetical protein
MKKAGVALLTLAICAGAAVGYHVYSRYHDLDETLHWMAQTYNPYPNGFGGHGNEVDPCQGAGCEEAPIIWKETISYEGCQVSTVTTSDIKTDHGLHETFNLRDIDSDSIKVAKAEHPPYGPQVQFAARDNAQALAYTGNIKDKGARSEFMMDNADYAERFATALRHAVELCGGRPSKF